MAGELNIFINLSAKSAETALVESFYQNSTIDGSAFSFRRDDLRNARLHFLEKVDNAEDGRPFRYVDPASWTSVKIAVGTPDLIPDSGTFTITDVAAGQTTAAIAYNAAAAAVQSAIQAALTTNFSTATVEDVSDSVWALNRVATGAFTTALTITATALSPAGSTGYVINTEDGTASLSEKWQLGLAKAQPILRTTGYSAFPSAGVTVTTEQTGSASAPERNKIFRVEWNADAYAGTVSLNFTGNTTAKVLAFGYDASEDDMRAVFETHVDVEPEGVRIKKSGPGDYLIELVGDGIAISDTPTLATSDNTLQVPVGLACSLPANTALVTQLLGDEDSVDAVMEVEIQKTSGLAETVLHVDGVTLTRDLIRNTPGSSTGTEIWAAQSGVVNFLPSVTGYTGGGSTNLDGALTSSAVPIPSLWAFIHSTDGERIYRLKSGTTAESSPTIIRPDDYAASTNERIFELIGGTGFAGFTGPTSAKVFTLPNASGNLFTDVLKIKASDTTRTSTDTPADDPDLTQSLVPGTYIVDVSVTVACESNTPGFRIQMASIGGSAVLAGNISIFNTSVSQRTTGFAPNNIDTTLSGFLVASNSLSASSRYGSCAQFSVVVTSTTTISVQWAQMTSDADDTTVKAGSYMRIARAL